MQRSILALSVGITAIAATLVAPPAQAASGEVVLERVMNDIPYNDKCVTAVITVYNASDQPVKSVSILFKGYNDDWRNGKTWMFINNAIREESWRTYPVYVRPGKRTTLRKRVCATWRTKTGFYVRGKAIRWTWY